MVREIPLTQGRVALVDDEDYAALAKFSWFAVRIGKHWYAARQMPGCGRRSLLMHRDLMGQPVGWLVDHANRDGLDNRRVNIRLATRAQNGANTPARSGSGFKGVFASGGLVRPWRARIQVAGHHRDLGRFASPVAAALAYDAAAFEAHGDFALLNFPIGTDATAMSARRLVAA